MLISTNRRAMAPRARREAPPEKKTAGPSSRMAWGCRAWPPHMRVWCGSPSSREQRGTRRRPRKKLLVRVAVWLGAAAPGPHTCGSGAAAHQVESNEASRAAHFEARLRASTLTFEGTTTHKQLLPMGRRNKLYSENSSKA